MHNDKHTPCLRYPKSENIQDLEWKEVKKLVLPCLVPVEWKFTMDKNNQLAYSSFLDFSICYYIRLKNGNGNKMKIAWVSRAALENWGIPMHTLKIQAIENMNKDGYTIQPINRFLSVLDEGFASENADVIPLYILTNQTSVFGASGILKTDLIAEFAKEIGKNLYIIPSSVHELLFLPDDGQIDVEDLKQIIKDVNDTLVRPQDILSDHAYYYNRITDEIRMEKQENES